MAAGPLRSTAGLSATARSPALLWAVLVLVVVALGLLVAALVTGRPGWAWGSVGASGVAAGLLLADWMGRRGSEPAAGPDDPSARRDPADAPGEPGERAVALDPSVEPAEEYTDVADAIVVSELDAEVWVIDERPRYHLRDCGWVGDRETIPLPIAEARELGFTPCAVCAPDSGLAALHRASRR